MGDRVGLYDNGPRPEGRGAVTCAVAYGSAALDARGVLEDATTAVLRLGDEALAALLHREVPGARRQLGDRVRRTVLAVQRAGHRNGEPERGELARRGRAALRGLLGLLRLRRVALGGLTLLGGAGVAVTLARLGAVRLLLAGREAVALAGARAVRGLPGPDALRRGGRAEERALNAGISGPATVPATSTMAASRPRISPAPALLTSRIVQKAVHSAKTVSAVPNWPRSSPTTLRPGMARLTMTSAAPMTPARKTLIRRPSESQAFGLSYREQSTPCGQS